MATDELTLRYAHARIREQVRKRLESYKGRDVLKTRFLVDRLDLAAEAYDYQAAVRPDGTVAKIEELIGFASDELLDFILMQSREVQLDAPEKGTEIECEVCRLVYDRTENARCPSCDHPNLFQIAEIELNDIAGKVKPDYGDPIAERIFAEMKALLLEVSYSRIVSCFESFHRRLNELAFEQRDEAVKKLPRPNLFQNLDATEGWFMQEHGVNPCQCFSPCDRSLLDQVFNKRHVIEHNGGVIDAVYVRRTRGDPDEIGQPVSVLAEEALGAVDLVRQVVEMARRMFGMEL